MRTLFALLVVGFLAACTNPYAQYMGSTLGIDTASGINALTSPIRKSGATETKISKDKLAQLKPGMTKSEVMELLQKPPTLVVTKGDGSSTATYNYGRSEQGATIFGKGEREFQTVVIEFNSEGKYVTHVLSESRMCGSQRTGYSAANCEDQAASANK